MHDCCDFPVDVIMANEHKSGGVCCLVTEVTDAPLKVDCPVSGTSSRKIQHRTVEHLVKSELAGSISDSQYYYCDAPDCSVVYFSQDSSGAFNQEDLQVAVFAKDQGKDVNVCYCFDWTRGRIEEEIKETGTSTVSRDVAEKVRADLCDCDIKNPKSTCCLGDLNRVVSALQ